MRIQTFLLLITLAGSSTTEALTRPQIQVLLNNGGTVTLPQGTHTIDGSLFFTRSGTTLTGSGDVILAFASGTGICGLVVGAADCRICGITIEGNSGPADPANSGAAGISVSRGGKDCQLQAVVLKGQAGDGIRLDGVSGVRIDGCTIEDFGENGVLLQPDAQGHGSDIVISRCQFQGSRVPEGAGIFVRGAGGFGARHIIITSNICRVNSDTGIEVGGIFDGYHASIVLTNNIVENAANAGIAVRSINDAVVSGNRILNCGSAVYGGDGIFCTGGSSVCRGLTVYGNCITLKQDPAGVNNAGVHVTNYEQILVAKNTVGSVNFGVWLEADEGRTFRQCSVLGNAVAYANAGVRIEGPAGYGNVQVQGNTVRVCTKGLQCLGDAGSICRFILVTNNHLEACTEAAIECSQVQKGRVNFNYLLNCPLGVSISGCSDVTETGTVPFTDTPPAPVPVAVEGTVILDGFLGDYRTVRVTFTFVPAAGGDNITRVLNLNSDGSFHLDDITQGRYRLVVESIFCLKAEFANLLVGASPTTLAALHLTTGDSSGNNRIAFEDFAILQNAYGLSGSAPAGGLAGAVDGCPLPGLVLLVGLVLAAYVFGGLPVGGAALSCGGSLKPKGLGEHFSRGDES